MCESMTRYMLHLLPALTRGRLPCLHLLNDVSMEYSKALPEASVLHKEAALVGEGVVCMRCSKVSLRRAGPHGDQAGLWRGRVRRMHGHGVQQ